MAYSNWGAFVHKDGVHREDREDVGVFDADEADIDSGLRIFVNIAKNRERYPDGNPPAHTHSQHAVLGDGPIRLVGYKSYPSLWHAKDDGDVITIELVPYLVRGGEDDYGDDTEYAGTYEGCTFRAYQYDGNMVDLELTEADGSQWAAKCGYLYGAGHMDYRGVTA